MPVAMSSILTTTVDAIATTENVPDDASSNTTHLTNNISVEMMLSTPTTGSYSVAAEPTPLSVLSESNPQFQLWYTVPIGLSLLLVISMVFVMAVLLCRIVKGKESKKHTYSPRSRQGSFPMKGSVYNIRSQENLELPNAHYHNQISQAHIQESGSESTVEEIAGNQGEELVHSVHQVAVSRSVGTERNLRLSEEEPSEEIEEEIESEGEAHMYDVPFDHIVVSQQHQSTNSRQNMTDGISDNSIRQGYHNNQPECLSLDMQESQQERETAVGNYATSSMNPSVTVTVAFEEDSHLRDIPGFHDPELRGDDEHDNNGLCVNIPPTIYSSQILTTVVHDNEEEDYNQHGMGTPDIGIGTESTVLSPHQLEETPIDSPLADFTCAITDRSIPSVRVSVEGSSHQSREASVDAESHWLKASVQEGSRESVVEAAKSITLHHDGLQPVDDDILYDKPIISHGKPSSAGAKDSDDLKLEGVDPRTLFDDPDYTKGMMQGSQPQQQPAEQNKTSGARAVSTQTFVPLKREQRKAQELDPGREAETRSLSVQLGQVPGMKSSINSLELLNFDDSELDELDPVVASCLRTPIMSDTDDEIAISEV